MADVKNELFAAVDAARADKVSMAALTAALKANDTAWNGDATAIEATLASRVKLGYTMEEQRAQLAILVAITQDHTSALAIERTAMDVAAITGRDFASVNLALGKAFEGNTTSLKKFGIQVATGTKGYDLLSIVQERYIGGAAAAVAADPSRALAANADVLRVKVGNLLLPVLNKLVSFANDALLPALTNALPVFVSLLGVVGDLGRLAIPLLVIALGIKLVGAFRTAAEVGVASANAVKLAWASALFGIPVLLEQAREKIMSNTTSGEGPFLIPASWFGIPPGSFDNTVKDATQGMQDMFPGCARAALRAWSQTPQKPPSPRSGPR